MFTDILKTRVEAPKTAPRSKVQDRSVRGGTRGHYGQGVSGQLQGFAPPPPPAPCRYQEYSPSASFWLLLWVCKALGWMLCVTFTSRHMKASTVQMGGRIGASLSNGIALALRGSIALILYCSSGCLVIFPPYLFNCSRQITYAVRIMPSGY